VRFRIASIPAFIALAAVAAFGQVMSSGSNTNGGFRGTATFSGSPPYAMPATTGAAYSGEEISETVQTLADGTHITRKMPGRKVWRDELGRTRSERPLFAGSQIQDAPVVIEIEDPVAGYKYTLDTDKHIAHRVALGGPPSPPPPGSRQPSVQMGMTGSVPTLAGLAMAAGAIRTGPQTTGSESLPQRQSERLGTRMIDGVLCEGYRTTTTYPVDSEGNDRPIVVTSESWLSRELKLTLLAKRNDPRMGETTFRLANLSRDLPDPNLFAVPPDYTVVDEKESFTIRYSR
jgi:hypothetical protein